ncbi:LuxR C-terminal-related transcriptional regulator [Clostridium oryzae]|uniref:HTH-type transcriptional regulator MalT n=1 Tax=Clostridium oryzae TaxID=1450648 RepID=A0A1V4IT35_9CLOT|nr:LuxR C-terminal-related transcriptional regulator [Clostridium oryzae]OPJ63063.1 HTH-type transcriptional regulator MalT [Clostridium oryzae]
MNEQPILMSTRLKMPEPRKDYIVRQQLFEKLKDIDQYSVIVAKGGAGTGKTTLISSFVKEKAMTNVKWISIDEGFNNIFMFWNYFVKAVEGELGASKSKLMSLFNFNFQKGNIESLLTLLINDLNIDENIFIVLDDFYNITDSSLLQSIEFFLKHMSDNIHMILLTRQEPLLYLGALNMEGKLLVIEDDDLKLSHEHGIKFLKDTLKLKLSPKILDFMDEISEGWIGGLQLIAAAASGRNESQIKNFNIKDKLINEYVTKEIYDGLEREEKEFLVVTSILPYFNEQICSRLLSNMNFTDILGKLQDKNIMIICIDEKIGVYRYHNILKEYLNNRFKELDREKQIMFHLKAAEAFRDINDYNECISQFIIGEDYNSAMNFILNFPGNAALFSYADMIPDKFIIKNADFAYQCFFYYFANMEFEKCSKIYNNVKMNMSDDLIFSAFKYANMFVEDTFKINEVDTIQIDNIERLPLLAATKAYIFIKEAYFLYVKCKYAEALSYVDKAVDYSAKQNNLYIVFFCFSIKSQILEDMGDLNECIELYKRMQKMLSDNESIFMLNSSFYVGITGLYLKQMNLVEAKSCLENAINLIPEINFSVDRGYKYNVAEYKFIKEENDEAINIVHELMETISYKNSVYMAGLLRYMFRVIKFAGDTVEKFKLCYETMEESRRSLDSKLLYADLFFHRGEDKEALMIIDDILKYARRYGIKLKLVQASLLKISIIYNNSEKKRDVINLFREALFYSSKNSMLSPYHFERETVRKLISDYDKDIRNEMSEDQKLHYKQIMDICDINSKSILSERELDVLKELAKGLSNKEIGQQLSISLATVKTHIINIYGKLQVNNRIAAVDAAKEQNLL